MSRPIPFLDVPKLPLSEAVKDEIMIAQLHGIDLLPFARRFKDNERVHCIRLLLQSGLDESDPILSDFSTTILRILTEYKRTHTEFRIILNKYIHTNNSLRVEESTLVKVLQAYLKYRSIYDYDFVEIHPDLVDTFVYAIRMNVDVQDLQEYAKTHPVEVVKLLINLRVAGVAIYSFLSGDWQTSQIYALISGSSIVEPSVLIEDYDLDETFPEGSIREIIRAYEVDPSLATLISTKDQDGIPIYNQYQMYEITEGIKLNLDVSSYYQPTLTDLEMRLKREELIRKEEKRSGKLFKERRLSKSTILLDDEQLNNIVYNNN